MEAYTRLRFSVESGCRKLLGLLAQVFEQFGRPIDGIGQVSWYPGESREGDIRDFFRLAR